MLDSLLEALEFSPNNIPLKLQVARLYKEKGDFDNAEKHLIAIIHLDPAHKEAKYLLASCFHNKNKVDAAMVLLEEITKNTTEQSHLELLCYCQLHLKDFAEAQQTYKRIVEENPAYANSDFDEYLKATITPQEDFTDDDALSFISKVDTSFEDVGGMDDVKKEIALKIIKPLQHKELYEAYGKKIGGGILLYGPPGCGKTHLARATAGEIDAHFINVGINDILDMWIGNSESNLHEVFEVARAHKPCVIFIDEIDALGANRNDVSKTAGRTVINQFLAELDGIQSDNDGVLVLGATNAPWYLDPAFRRPGRFDRIIFVSPPDEIAREAIFKLQLKDKPAMNLDYKTLAKKSKEFSGADIQAAVDRAVEVKLEASFKDGIPKPLETKDVLKGIKNSKPSTKEWFRAAKNYALYANESGLYDEILDYLNIRKP